MPNWFNDHRKTLDKALDACEKRYAWTAFQENPSSKIHGKEKPIAGKKRFEDMLGKHFELDLPGQEGSTGAEVSPYTQEPLSITYPKVSINALYKGIHTAMPAWRDTNIETRVGVCLEILDRCSQQLFENAYATMHTSGQSFIMAFAGSGANALDRGLEALAYAYKAMKDIPLTATWERRFGREEAVTLEKRFRLMPRGVGVVICCATFPLWNGYPALFANLATGNPVVLKPHPNAILPVALVASVCREVLSEAGFDPNIVTLVADTRNEPATKSLLEHASTAIIDFTGSPYFGRWIEKHCRKALVYTETAGCNSVVIESTDNMMAMATAIAHSLCQASAQMCTSVQNIHIPASGITVSGENISFDQVCKAIIDAVDALLESPKNAAFLCGALVTDDIYKTIERCRTSAAESGVVLRESRVIDNPEFPNARTATPLILQVTDTDNDLYREELFGPVSFLIKSENADECLLEATRNVKECGAITSHVYSTDTRFLGKAIDAYNIAGASVACNLIGMPINFAAAYSDFHVTGLNPAGNACLTDLAFVTDRFRVVQSKVMV